MQVDFEEKGHVYFVNGEIASISVTELLHKHGLAPDYTGVSKESLDNAAAKGKEVHKDLENIVNTPGYKPTTPQGKEFLEWSKENMSCGVAELPIGYEQDGMIIAGTADLVGFTPEGAMFIADHKNTTTFQREYVSWQVSLLDYFFRKLKGEKLNGKVFNWKGATEFWCLKYDPKTGKLTPKELKKVPDKDIQELLDDEYNNNKYQRKELVVDEELQKQFLTAEEYLIKMENEYKQATENAKRLREEMLKLFESQNIKSWENDKIKVTYVEQQERLSVDSTKLKKEYPMAWDKCQKITKVKPQIRVKIKGENEDEESI